MIGKIHFSKFNVGSTVLMALMCLVLHCLPGQQWMKLYDMSNPFSLLVSYGMEYDINWLWNHVFGYEFGDELFARFYLSLLTIGQFFFVSLLFEYTLHEFTKKPQYIWSPSLPELDYYVSKYLTKISFRSRFVVSLFVTVFASIFVPLYFFVIASVMEGDYGAIWIATCIVVGIMAISSAIIFVASKLKFAMTIGTFASLGAFLSCVLFLVFFYKSFMWKADFLVIYLLFSWIYGGAAGSFFWYLARPDQWIGVHEGKNE